MVRTHSISTALSMRPVQTAVGLGLLGAAMVGAVTMLSRTQSPRRAMLTQPAFDLQATQRWSRRDMPESYAANPRGYADDAPRAVDDERITRDMDPPDLTQTMS